MITVAIAGAAVSIVISGSITPASAQAPVASARAPAPTPTTPWGEPDLQGIWTDETDTPLQRSPKYASQEFFTEAQRAELDLQRGSMLGRERRAERGTTADVAGAYNDVFTPKKRTGARTSRIVDPPNGRLPSLTPEAQKAAVVMDGSPHLPASIRQWFGDSRGRWEGNTLVIDVTNFTPKTDFQGSRENLHLVERWTRTGPTTLEYAVTVEDPTVWARPWTAKQEFILQNNEENRIYTEPRCIEGNYGLPGLLHGHRAEELAFAKGLGVDPRTISTIAANEGEPDPLQ
jgi:hypothetical protein